MRSPASRIVLFERTGCHLCEDAARVLDETIGPAGYERVDIDPVDELVVRYGFRVPVIAVDGVDRLEAPIDQDELRRLLVAMGEG